MGQCLFMAKIKNICVLGSTGSIGKNSLDVVANFPDMFRVRYLTANKNIGELRRQIARFRPKGVAVLDAPSAAALKKTVNGSVEFFAGEEGLQELAGRSDVDVVINSLVGFVGLKPTIEALKQGKTVALANKETLVVAGEIIMKLVKKHGSSLVPIDSEHSAILQCLAGENRGNIRRLILTASGGPFLNLNKKEFQNVTVGAALKHPNWKMGNKITIDSATLMNKGLEVIEARWLFDLPPEKIEVVIHPQSIIHSMVEFVDGSIKAQLGVPDMKIPIQYALTYPDRHFSTFKRVNFPELKEMTFFQPNLKKFECLGLAYRALHLGGTAPAILNAANEVAVQLFMHKRITFNWIPRLIRHALDHTTVNQSPTLGDILEADTMGRDCVAAYIDRKR